MSLVSVKEGLPKSCFHKEIECHLKLIPIADGGTVYSMEWSFGASIGVEWSQILEWKSRMEFSCDVCVCVCY